MVPAPNAYKIYGEIERNVRKGKGRVMGIGREVSDDSFNDKIY